VVSMRGPVNATYALHALVPALGALDGCACPPLHSLTHRPSPPPAPRAMDGVLVVAAPG
jgi:hypothetical protein